MNENHGKIRITADDVERADVPASQVEAPQPNPATGSGPKQWGYVSGAPHAPNTTASSSVENFLLKSWVYLGLAGAAGAFLAWALCEPSFIESDDGAAQWGNGLMLPLVITLICVGLAVAESLVERSTQKAVTKGLLAAGIGIIFGFIFQEICGVLFTLLVTDQPRSEITIGLMSARSISWAVLGIAGGLVYGIIGRSGKKCLYGILGGALGASIGGLLFDPISLLTQGAEISRCVGFTILGASTGIAIGLVESALKNRWLYVSGGPLAGKQFILYKPVTTLGSQQANDIYLFKDPAISPSHATIEIQGAAAILLATGPIAVGGQPVHRHTLRNGDNIQIGRYVFNYQEKQTHGR